MKFKISMDTLSKPAHNMRIKPGDLVMRKYSINLAHIALIGLVVNRDRNGFLDVMWGNKLEHMWDDYDLERIE